MGYELGEGRILTKLAKAPERQRQGKRIGKAGGVTVTSWVGEQGGGV